MEGPRGQRMTIRLGGGGPWGFRLQGDPEQGLPLTVSKVRAKSKAYNMLFEGDIVVSVNCIECNNLTYDQAMDLMDDSTNDLTLDIIRCNLDFGQEVEKLNQQPPIEIQPEETKAQVEVAHSVVLQTDENQQKVIEDIVISEILPKSLQHTPMSVEGETKVLNGVAGNESLWKHQEQHEQEEHEEPDDGSDLEEEIVAACEQLQVEDTTDKEGSLDTIPEFTTTVDTSHEDAWEGIADDGSLLQEHQELSGPSPTAVDAIVNGDVPPKLPPDDTVAGTSDLSRENSHFWQTTTGTQPEGTAAIMGSIDHMFRVSKISKSSAQVWSPIGPFQNVTTNTSNTISPAPQILLGNDLQQSFNVVPRSPPPPAPPLPPPNLRNQRPLSMPTIELNGIDHFETKRPLSGELDPKRIWKVLQPPPPEEMEAINMVRRSKGKMFSSSSFYDEPGHIYPTVEEQVELCKKISQSLSADTNKQSKGSSMYIKRMKKSQKWIFEGPDPDEIEEPVVSPAEGRNKAPISAPTTNYVPDQSRPKLKLVLDPRQLKDAMKLRASGLYNEHNVVSPEICFDLVKDLNSPTGKGAALFAKRKKKSEKWVVDEETVKEHEYKHNVQLQQLPTFRLDTRTPNTGNYIPDNKLTSKLEELQDMLSHPRLKLVKSPWEAALESPIGSCDAAFQVVVPTRGLGGSVANTAIRKSHTFHTTTTSTYHTLPRCFSPAKVPSPAPAPAPAPALASAPAPPARATPSSLSPRFDIYKPRAPQVWSGQSSDTSSGRISAEPLLHSSSATNDNYFPSPSSTLSSLYNRNRSPNFNTLPRVWGESSNSQFGFKPVKAPTLLF